MGDPAAQRTRGAEASGLDVAPSATTRRPAAGGRLPRPWRAGDRGQAWAGRPGWPSPADSARVEYGVREGDQLPANRTRYVTRTSSERTGAGQFLYDGLPGIKT